MTTKRQKTRLSKARATGQGAAIADTSRESSAKSATDAHSPDEEDGLEQLRELIGQLRAQAPSERAHEALCQHLLDAVATLAWVVERANEEDVSRGEPGGARRTAKSAQRRAVEDLASEAQETLSRIRVSLDLSSLMSRTSDF